MSSTRTMIKSSLAATVIAVGNQIATAAAQPMPSIPPDFTSDDDTVDGKNLAVGMTALVLAFLFCATAALLLCIDWSKCCKGEEGVSKKPLLPTTTPSTPSTKSATSSQHGVFNNNYSGSINAETMKENARGNINIIKSCLSSCLRLGKRN